MNDKLYVLLGNIDYEGSSLLGVFTSPEKAQRAMDEKLRSGKGRFDELEIAVVTPDEFDSGMPFELVVTK